MSRKISRRGFLAGTSAASAVSPLVLPSAVLGKEGQLPPSERITIAVFGVGNRGRHSLSAMRPPPDHQVVAIAEARRDRGQSACQMTEEFYSQRLGKTSYSGCKLYSDFRDVLARDDIDAIWGTVPDHWHGCLYSRVIESGKDIYGEKPLSRWIAQGVKLKKLVRQYGTIFQVGLQQRSDPKFRLACNLARNGYLGKVAEVQVAAPGGTVIPAVPPCDPPDGFDECIQSRKKPHADVEIVHRSTSLALLANISLATQSTLRWDPEREVITNHKEANQLLHYEYRKPWKLE